MVWTVQPSRCGSAALFSIELKHSPTMDAPNITVEHRIKSLKGPVFVFGAGGFIGANLFETLLKVRQDCYAITHNMRAAWRLKLLGPNPENVLFCDILFKDSVRRVFRKLRPGTVFDLSAYGAYSKQD